MRQKRYGPASKPYVSIPSADNVDKITVVPESMQLRITVTDLGYQLLIWSDGVKMLLRFIVQF